MVKTGYKYLDDINSPKDLRRLSVPELETLAAELRDFMVSELCVNNMSISPNVGALKEYLLGITTSKHYNRLKNRVWNAMSGVPRMRRAIQNFGNVVKQSILKQSNLFESLNFRYFGPVDGHDLKSLVRVLGDMRSIPGPKLLHVVTKKGKGYKPAESNPPIWHAPGRFNPGDNQPDRYQDVFGYTLLELARLDERVVGVTPAMLTGSSMDILQREMPHRCFDVGIAEGHAVTFSAGLAAGGLIPFCNIYSSFMQRAYDHMIHDVAIQRLPVIFCLDRAGLVGEDGVTHHGVFDLAFMRSVPNMTIAAPANEAELKEMMYTALLSGVPFAIRYPRGRGIGADWSGGFRRMEIGRGITLRGGKDVAVLAIGTVTNDALKAAVQAEEEGISAEVVSLRFAKPLDTAILHDVGRRFRRIITVEDGTVEGGVGSAVAEFISANGYTAEVVRLGIPDTFIHHGTIAELKRICGYDTEGILTAIRKAAGREKA